MRKLMGFWQRRRERKNQARYGKGFGWAMTAYWLDNLSLDHIESCVMDPYDKEDPFDAGARHAVYLLESIELLQLQHQADKDEEVDHGVRPH